MGMGHNGVTRMCLNAWSFCELLLMFELVYYVTIEQL